MTLILIIFWSEKAKDLGRDVISVHRKQVAKVAM